MQIGFFGIVWIVCLVLIILGTIPWWWLVVIPAAWLAVVGLLIGLHIWSR